MVIKDVPGKALPAGHITGLSDSLPDDTPLSFAGDIFHRGNSHIPPPGSRANAPGVPGCCTSRCGGRNRRMTLRIGDRCSRIIDGSPSVSYDRYLPYSLPFQFSAQFDIGSRHRIVLHDFILPVELRTSPHRYNFNSLQKIKTGRIRENRDWAGFSTGFFCFIPRKH